MASPKKKPAKKPHVWLEPLSPLHVLLTEAFPKKQTINKVLDVKWLAERLGVTDEGVYTWLRANSIPFRRAKQITDLRVCTKTLKDLLPFVS